MKNIFQYNWSEIHTLPSFRPEIRLTRYDQCPPTHVLKLTSGAPLHYCLVRSSSGTFMHRPPETPTKKGTSALTMPQPDPAAIKNRSGTNATPPVSQDPIATVRDQSRHLFRDAAGSHDWEHTLRVHRLCRHIGPKEGADMVVLECAAYLHDIGRAAQDRSNGDVCHAIKGAQMASDIVAKLPFDDAQKANIVHCVRSHRFRGKERPSSTEARVLFDADKLDAIGAVGVARAYLFAGELGACLHNPDIPPEQARPYSRDDTGHREFVVKLSRIRERIITDEGKRLANERHAFMTRFFERFLEEYEGVR